jgi:hypothetical protein
LERRWLPEVVANFEEKLEKWKRGEGKKLEEWKRGGGEKVEKGK